MLIHEQYVSEGGKWVRMRVPSTPSHMNEWCGNLVVSFHEIFCVRNQSNPARRAICGHAPVYPKLSGSQMPRGATPRCSLK